MPTPLRNFRLDDDTWQRLKDRADADGTDVSTVIRKLITQHLNK